MGCKAADDGFTTEGDTTVQNCSLQTGHLFKCSTIIILKCGTWNTHPLSLSLTHTHAHTHTHACTMHTNKVRCKQSHSQQSYSLGRIISWHRLEYNLSLWSWMPPGKQKHNKQLEKNLLLLVKMLILPHRPDLHLQCRKIESETVSKFNRLTKTPPYLDHLILM